MRRAASEDAGATFTKCEITGNRKARRRGCRRTIGFPPQPSGLPGIPIPFPFSRLVPPRPLLLPGLLAPSPIGSPPPRFSPGPSEGVSSRQRGPFRARLRKLLAFSPRFAVFSHPNFAAKSPVFRNLTPSARPATRHGACARRKRRMSAAVSPATAKKAAVRRTETPDALPRAPCGGIKKPRRVPGFRCARRRATSR